MKSENSRLGKTVISSEAARKLSIGSRMRIGALDCQQRYVQDYVPLQLLEKRGEWVWRKEQAGFCIAEWLRGRKRIKKTYTSLGVFRPSTLTAATEGNHKRLDDHGNKGGVGGKDSGCFSKGVSLQSSRERERKGGRAPFGGCGKKKNMVRHHG